MTLIMTPFLVLLVTLSPQLKIVFTHRKKVRQPSTVGEAVRLLYDPYYDPHSSVAGHIEPLAKDRVHPLKESGIAFCCWPGNLSS